MPQLGEQADSSTSKKVVELSHAGIDRTLGSWPPERPLRPYSQTCGVPAESRTVNARLSSPASARGRIPAAAQEVKGVRPWIRSRVSEEPAVGAPRMEAVHEAPTRPGGRHGGDVPEQVEDGDDAGPRGAGIALGRVPRDHGLGHELRL